MRILNKTRGIVLAVLAASVLTYHATPFSAVVDAAALPLRSAFGPVFGLGNTFAELVDVLRSRSALREQIAEREQTITLLAQKLENREAESQEARVAAFPFIAARVVAVQRFGGTRMLLADQGSLAGVSENAGVATPRGVFVGKVAAVFPRFSLVLPLTDSESAVAATVSGTDVQAVAQGSRGAGLSLELVAQDAPVAAGDVVATSLLEEQTPAGLLIGAIATIEYVEGELFKRAELSPFASLAELSEIVIFAPFSPVGEEE